MGVTSTKIPYTKNKRAIISLVIVLFLLEWIMKNKRLESMLFEYRKLKKYYCDKCVKKDNCNKVVKKCIRENINKKGYE